ncbi:Zinc finger C2H2 [Penicillium brevicompactum]|uniref:Zinc finger C2H2 n=1 Tax=Penicillium brevicompactum TaxID=5074 RepID=UPI00254140AF|nr:Zinc finger C2H2 [Penicillium brevicompactum]KAJ5346879.1 Zinc finger C2H2 [Penicillium brevicompactum]
MEPEITLLCNPEDDSIFPSPGTHANPMEIASFDEHSAGSSSIPIDIGEMCDYPMAASEALSSLAINTKQDSGSPKSVSKSEWRFEEAEMPSISMTDVASDGLYYCQRETCRDRKGFQQKGVFR